MPAASAAEACADDTSRMEFIEGFFCLAALRLLMDLGLRNGSGFGAVSGTSGSSWILGSGEGISGMRYRDMVTELALEAELVRPVIDMV